ncbi:capsid protein [Babaco ilarvirus 1]|nr:capsid protein [Babaco ilarvirus 1]
MRYRVDYVHERTIYFLSFISLSTNIQGNIMVCRLCNHTHAGGCARCKKCHPTGAQAPTPRAQQRTKNNPNKGQTSGSKSKQVEWTIRGPHMSPIVPRGHVEHVNKEVVAEQAGRLVNIDFSTAFPGLMGRGLHILTVLVRVNSFCSSGWVGLVEGFNPADPKGPDPLKRKVFLKDQCRGWQWMAPADLEYDRFARECRLVFQFKTEFAANAKVIMRDLYVVTTELPRVVIPNDLLHVDEDLLEV